MKGRPEVLLPYPVVMTEAETLEAAIAGRSITRLGDGELRLADGGTAVSQIGHPRIRGEMRNVLLGTHECLVCIPHMRGPKYHKTWRRYEMNKYISMYQRKEYGSAFITRPDSAPWIDTPEYWSRVRTLWQGKDIIAVLGPEGRSLTPEMLSDAKSCRVVYGPRRDAYEEIKRIEEEIGKLEQGQIVILCLGACATILAVRLHTKWKAHALDLGHIGRMMRSAGRWFDGVADGTE